MRDRRRKADPARRVPRRPGKIAPLSQSYLIRAIQLEYRELGKRSSLERRE